MNPKTTGWPWLIAAWFVVTVVALLTRPLLPVDETRYASVAWEMWSRGDFLVPSLNGEPYSHKPPLYFWLVQGGWWLFGVHEWVLRLVAPVVALLVLFASTRLSRQLWPGNDSTARLTPWLVLGSTFFAAFASWVQMDMLLVLMTVLGMTGIALAAREGIRGWLLTGVALGLGILAKGPVILLHVLPVALLAPLWRPGEQGGSWWRWYAGLLASVVLAALLALAWALPAATSGGEAYRAAILWGQTANRIIGSFAHAHPPWWYLPWLPLLLLPWVLLPWGWSALRHAPLRLDPGLRLCLVWLVATLLLMSLVSGKQIKYLLPLVPAMALVLARVWAPMAAQRVMQRPWLLSAALLLGGGLLASVPLWANAAPWMADIGPQWGTLLVVTAFLLLWLPPLTVAVYPRLLTLLSVWVVVILHLGIYRTAAPAYDLQAVSAFIARAQADGRQVAIGGRYHGQFGFPGRLQRALLEVPAGTVLDWAAQHPGDYLVVISRQPLPAYPKAVFTQPYRSGYLALWSGEAVTTHPAILH